MKLMSRTRKTVIALAAVTFVSAFAGCKKDFLDRDPQGRYTEDNYPYPGGSGPYDTYLFGAYNYLRAFDLHSQSFIAASFRSDDADKGSTPADGGANASTMDNFPVAPTNGFCNTLWNGNYTLVSRCNVALDQVLNNAAIQATPEVKKQSEAEMRFLRAYAYFNLVRYFGRVPIVDRIFSDPAAQANIPQSAPAAVYAFIEADLQFAAANLPPSWDPKFVGRITSGSANALLAKVYLTQQKWAAAMGAASAVMNSGQYDLSTPYDKIFREDGENSKESVFEVQAHATPTAQTDQYGVQYAQIQGVRGAGVWDLGWGWNTPSDDLANSYEPGDPRRARTILFTSTGSTPGITIYGETTPVGLPNPRYNNKVYSNPAMRASIGHRMGYWMNIRLIRYADVVLMFAEAANEVGGVANITAARNALNSVRLRARAGNNAILPDVLAADQATLREAIRKERRIELAMEHDRFFDLVRWGISQTVLNAHGKANFVASRDNLLPIPQTQIDLSKGVLTQNPGY